MEPDQHTGVDSQSHRGNGPKIQHKAHCVHMIMNIEVYVERFGWLCVHVTTGTSSNAVDLTANWHLEINFHQVVFRKCQHQAGTNTTVL